MPTLRTLAGRTVEVVAKDQTRRRHPGAQAIAAYQEFLDVGACSAPQRPEAMLRRLGDLSMDLRGQSPRQAEKR